MQEEAGFMTRDGRVRYLRNGALRSGRDLFAGFYQGVYGKAGGKFVVNISYSRRVFG